MAVFITTNIHVPGSGEEKIRLYPSMLVTDFQTRRKVYPNTHQRFVSMADDKMPELTSEIGRNLEVSAPLPQMVQNTTAGGKIHQLNPTVSVYPQDLLLNHLHSMPPSAPGADLLISSPTALLADVLSTPAPTQQTEHLQPSMLNVAQSSNMAKNETIMLQIDDSNKQLPHKTKGISQPRFVASSADSMVIDRKRKGKEHHGDSQTEEAKYKRTGKEKGESVAPSLQKSRDKHNLSEKKRRDKINEKFKSLQMITRCRQKDQVSILETAIAEIKSLQWQKETLSRLEQCCIMPSPHNQPAPNGSPNR